MRPLISRNVSKPSEPVSFYCQPDPATVTTTSSATDRSQQVIITWYINAQPLIGQSSSLFNGFCRATPCLDRRAVSVRLSICLSRSYCIEMSKYIQCWNYKNANGGPVFASEASEKIFFRPLLGGQKKLIVWLWRTVRTVSCCLLSNATKSSAQRRYTYRIHPVFIT